MRKLFFASLLLVICVSSCWELSALGNAEDDALSKQMQKIENCCFAYQTSKGEQRLALKSEVGERIRAIQAEIAESSLIGESLHSLESTLLRFAIGCNLPEQVAHLLEDRGVSPNMSFECNNSSPLYIAVLVADSTIVSLLIEHGAEVNAINPLGDTVLLGALLRFLNQDYAQSLAILQQLFEAGACPKLTDQDGDTPLEAIQKVFGDRGVFSALRHPIRVARMGYVAQIAFDDPQRPSLCSVAAGIYQIYRAMTVFRRYEAEHVCSAACKEHLLKA